jgi:hypothetical protein
MLKDNVPIIVKCIDHRTSDMEADNVNQHMGQWESCGALTGASMDVSPGCSADSRGPVEQVRNQSPPLVFDGYNGQLVSPHLQMYWELHWERDEIPWTARPPLFYRPSCQRGFTERNQQGHQGFQEWQMQADSVPRNSGAPLVSARRRYRARRDQTVQRRRHQYERRYQQRERRRHMRHLQTMAENTQETGWHLPELELHTGFEFPDFN